MLKPPLALPQQLPEYAAAYDSDEPDADDQLTLEGNSLVLQFGEILRPALTAAANADVFTAPGGVIFHSS